MKDELITLAELSTLGAAEAAKSLLEAEGISTLVQESDALRFDPFSPRPGIHIRLQVRAADAAEARELLAAVAEDPGDDDPSEK